MHRTGILAALAADNYPIDVIQPLSLKAGAPGAVAAASGNGSVLTEGKVMKSTREYGEGSSGGIPPKAVTPIERVEEALREAADLAQKTMSMVATIAGSYGPVDDRRDEGYRPDDGIIPALAERADDTASVIRSAKAELIRLADLLGV
ncbi:hypothetical protein ABVB72_04455 [Rhizobium nepotum]|uniref:hypothetical protein n=1 Tax=Rhizobium nepotum TaxID=1035271 RepID=UPI00336A00FF